MKLRTFKVFFIAILVIFFTFPSYCDDEDLDDTSFISIDVSSDATKVPIVNARHAVVFDRSSKHVIFGKEENEKCKMASTTKIMTAIIVIENANLEDVVKVSSKAARTGGSRLGLSANDTITVENLLYGLMMKSGNDAAVALAEHVSGSVESFSFMMNSKAKDLGLCSTNFVTPHGLDNDDHYTTAFELAFLADYALKNEVFSKIVKTKTYTIYLNGHTKTLNNTNELLGNLDGIYGVKTGFTNGANRCLVTSCKRGNLDIICVVLGCDTKKDRTTDSVKLINYTFKNFSLVNIKDVLIKDFNDWVLTHKDSFTINKGVTHSLYLYLDESDFDFSHAAVNNSELKSISTNVTFDAYFEAPVYKGTKIGEISLYVGDTNYLSIDILSKNTIYKKNFSYYIFNILKNFNIFFMAYE